MSMPLGSGGGVAVLEGDQSVGEESFHFIQFRYLSCVFFFFD